MLSLNTCRKTWVYNRVNSVPRALEEHVVMLNQVSMLDLPPIEKQLCLSNREPFVQLEEYLKLSKNLRYLKKSFGKNTLFLFVPFLFPPFFLIFTVF